MADRSVVVRLRAEIAGFKSAMNEAAESAKKVGSGADESAKKADTAMGRMVQSATQNREAWNTAGTALTVFGGTVTAALGATVKAAMDWESAWTGVTKTVDGTPAQLAAVEDGLRGLTSVLPASHTEIAAVAEAAGQLGIQTDNVVGFTKVMIDLGETTNMSAEEAASSLAQFMNVMGTSQGDIDRLGSVIVGLGNNFATTERDIVEMSQRLAAAGAIAGMTEPQVMGIATAMSSIGINAEAGGSAMSQIIQKISKAVADGGASMERYAEVAGMSAQQFSTAWKNDPVAAIDAFVTGLANMNESGENSYKILDDLGLSGIRQTAVLQGLATATGLMTESVDMASTAWAENTALIEEAEKRYGTTESKIAIAKNALSDAAIEMGAVFLPAIASLAEGVADLATWFGDLPAPVQRALGVLGGVTGAASLAAGAFLLVFPRVIETVSAFQKLSGIAPTLTGRLQTVGKAVGKGSVLALGLVALVHGLDAINNASRDAIPSVTQMTEALLQMEGVAGVEEKFSNISGAFDDMKGAADTLLEGGGLGFSRWGEEVFGGLLGVEGASHKAADAFARLGESIATIYSSNPEEAEKRFQAAMAETGRTREEMLSLMPAYADALADTEVQQKLAADSATGLGDAVGQAGTAALANKEAWEEYETLLAGIDEGISEAGDAFRDFLAGSEESMDSWISNLNSQADAIVAWRENYKTAMSQIAVNFDEGGRNAAEAFIGSILEKGPDGAQALQQFVNATPEQQRELIAAWERTGWEIADTVSEVARNAPLPEFFLAVNTDSALDTVNTLLFSTIPGMPPSTVNLGADTEPADETIANWQNTMMGTTTTTMVAADTAQAVAAAKEWFAATAALYPIPMIGAADLDARGVAQEWVDWTQAQNPTPMVGAMDGDARGVTEAWAGWAGGLNPTPMVGALDSDARGKVDSLMGWTAMQRADVNVFANTAEAERQIAWLTRARTVAVSFVPGAMPSAGRATGGPVEGFAGGGAIRGPGTGTSDSIPAIGPMGRMLRVSNGEHIVTDAEVRAAGGHDAIYEIRAAIRAGAFRRYATGGEVTPRYMPGVVSRQPAVGAGAGIDYDRLAAAMAGQQVGLLDALADRLRPSMRDWSRLAAAGGL